MDEPPPVAVPEPRSEPAPGPGPWPGPDTPDLVWNPFAVLGLPEWPDLDDETVHAAWQQIAAETHPDRPDGGNLARYTQATAAYFELSCPWGRSEAFADLLEQAWAEGRYDAYPSHHPPGDDPAGPLPPRPWDAELGPIPLDEVLHLLAEIPVGPEPHGLCVWPQPGRYSLGHTGVMR